MCGGTLVYVFPFLPTAMENPPDRHPLEQNAGRHDGCHPPNRAQGNQPSNQGPVFIYSSIGPAYMSSNCCGSNNLRNTARIIWVWLRTPRRLLLTIFINILGIK